MPYFKVPYTITTHGKEYVFAEDKDSALVKAKGNDDGNSILEITYDTPIEVNPSRAVDNAVRMMSWAYKDETEAERDKIVMRDIKNIEGIDVDLAFAYYKARCALNEIVEEEEDVSDLIQ